MTRFLRNRQGSTIVEFALVAPFLLLVLTGGLQLGYIVYVKAALEGEMQKASRDRTLESAGSSTQRTLLENRLRDAVRRVAPKANVVFTRKAYRDYSNVASYEEFNDTNNNGRCDPKEVYLDANNSGMWDLDSGTSNSDGGATDIVIYTATVDYNRLPLGRLLPWAPTGQLTAKTALRNQPFDKQGSIVERSC